MGYPGGKARIIHKESDIITAFAVNKVSIKDVGSSNCGVKEGAVSL